MSDVINTLTGLTLTEALAQLDDPLPPEAYNPVPGGADLTDIDPNWMRVRLTEVFGLCGYGWGYEYEPESVSFTWTSQHTQDGDREVCLAVIKQLRFWYTLRIKSNSTKTCTVPATGANKSPNAAYALKGAISNAIGHAVSNIMFQISVYTGKRDHRTVKKGNDAKTKSKSMTTKASSQTKKGTKPKTAGAKATTTAGNGSKPKSKPPSDGNGKADAEIIAKLNSDDDLSPDEVRKAFDFVIPFGKHKGMTLEELPVEELEYFADKMRPYNDLGITLQNAARIVLEKGLVIPF